MPSIELRFISEMLRTQSMRESTKAGFRREFLKDPDALQLYDYIHRHYNNTATKKQMPLLEDLQRRFPWFRMVEGDEHAGKIASFVDHMKTMAMSSDLASLAEHFSELVKYDEERALEVLCNSIPQIRKKYKSSSGFGILEVVEEVQKAYEGAQAGTAYGIPWPWECLTQDTMGKNPGDFVVFYGRMKSMKTWVLLYCAAMDYLEYNQRVLIWSKEMDARKVQLRLGSLLARVDYQLLKKGLLPPNLYDRAMATLRNLAEQFSIAEMDKDHRAKYGYADLIALCGPDAPRNIDGLKAAIDTYQPDVVYLDSFYHLEASRAKDTRQLWAKYQYLAEDVKQEIALNYNIPVVAAAQANRSGEKNPGESMVDMAGTDAIAREADLVIRVIKKRSGELNEPEYEGAFADARRKPSLGIKIPVADKLKKPAPNLKVPKEMPVRSGAELALILPGNREGVLDAFTIHAIPGYNFQVIESNFSSETVKDWIKKEDQAEKKESQKFGSTGAKKKSPKGPKMVEEPTIPPVFDFSDR